MEKYARTSKCNLFSAALLALTLEWLRATSTTARDKPQKKARK